MTPFVQFIMWALAPIALPISSALDRFLGHDDDEDMASYNRMEIGALVRIMHEEEAKRKNKHKHKHIGQLSVRAARSSLMKRESIEEDLDDDNSLGMHSDYTAADRMQSDTSVNLLHTDEVTMIEGALTMKVKTIEEVGYVRLHDVYTISQDLVLDYPTVVDIYSSGHSRVPVFAAAAVVTNNNGDDNIHIDSINDEDDEKHVLTRSKNKSTKAKRAITGVLKTKQLIVVDPNDQRSVSSMPLQEPWCVSPEMNMIDLLNIFQHGRRGKRGGHLAIVCRDPKLARSALGQGQPIPNDADVLGIITLEDVIEVLLQEPIFDESDAIEVAEMNRAKWAIGRWRSMMRRNKSRTKRVAQADSDDGGGLLLRGASGNDGYSYDSISREIV